MKKWIGQSPRLLDVVEDKRGCCPLADSERTGEGVKRQFVFSFLLVNGNLYF